ncbi:MAG: methylthioribulose 1-phosphate dehydratase [Pseudomonadales bacterium]|nr:methylthioribulose 1-phosphate dehydratase [Pseudomonadales bacterium]
MNNHPTYPLDISFLQSARALIETAQQIYQRGWAPATSSNFSARLDTATCAITVSGKDKGKLMPDDIMRVDFNGQAYDERKPSAETQLHTQLYLHDSTIGAVLHTHSMNATLASLTAADAICLKDMELLKAFNGITSHESSLRIPVFANTQDIPALASQVSQDMQAHGTGHAYLIRGHGVYTWGRDLNEAMRHLEALEYLFEFNWRLQGSGRQGQGI